MRNASFSPSFNKVGIGACIRDVGGNFVIAKTEWLTPIIDVDMGERTQPGEHRF
ncbi:hypothetical protein MTR_3g072290 [Medicago truncatula]|uniref:Uncharacterized protein n=1 Tax=Medicago truncatula TaxID=3880 RepID=G7J2Z3_MEDTR|nr:hypothetical protein MTR_3g072290 [Medicago truncatula]